MRALAKLAHSIDSLFGMPNLTDDIKDLAIVGVGAAGGAIGAGVVMDRVAFLRERPWWQQSLILAGVGVGGALVMVKFLPKQVKGLGVGFGAALIGSAIAKTANNFLPQLGGGAVGDYDGDNLLGVSTEEWNPYPGQSLDGFSTSGPSFIPGGGFNGLGVTTERKTSLGSFLS